MPTNRRPVHRDYHPPISPEALSLWRQCCELERKGATSGAEYSALGKRLAIACGLDWCSMSWPTTVTKPDPPPHIARNDALAPDWAAAWRTRLGLIEAAEAEDVVLDGDCVRLEAGLSRWEPDPMAALQKKRK